MNIVVLILTVFFAVSVVIVAMVIIILRKARKEEEKLVKRAVEDSRKQAELEAKAKKEADDKAHKEAELIAKTAANKNAEERARLATALKHEIEERRKAEEKTAEEKLRKEREEESLRKEEERLEKIKAEEEKIEQEAREKATKEEAERKQFEDEENKGKAEEQKQLAMLKAEQEAQAKIDKEEKATKEEAKKKEELEPRLEGEEGKERQELPPYKRGGRSRDSTKESGTEQSPELKLRSLKPEIICWDEGWRWIVGLEVPEKFESHRVTQNDELLEQDTSNESHYHLKHIEGTVKVAWTEGEQNREIDIPIMEEDRKYLIFKMRKNWKGLGRLVRRHMAGYYLIIAPQEWKRDEETSASTPDKLENIQIDGYKAHFFYQGQNGDKAIAFINTKGNRVQVKSGSSRFQLVGKEISDSSEDMGPLFGEKPPCIKTIDEREWGNVGVLVIGEEGSGRNRWRTQFVPQEGAKEQRMPDELTNRRDGWYFVRIYDQNNNLLESMDFRFIAGLKDIQIMNSECLPEPHGYNDIIVQFIHQANCKVEQAGEEIHHALTIRRENDFTIVTIPPKPDYDKTHWILRDGDTEIKVTILVERVWWCVGKIELAPVDWTDKPTTLSRRDFAATSDKALWVKFPRNRWVSKIEVGFNRTKADIINVEVEKKEIGVPLRDFCTKEEIGNTLVEFAMKIWVSPEGTKTYEAIVLEISAKLPPTVEPGEVQVKLPPLRYPTRQVQQPPLPPPQPEVKSRRGKRRGKGFSKNEIAKARLTMKDVKRLNIPYDKRRKSSHSWNIEVLKSATER